MTIWSGSAPLDSGLLQADARAHRVADWPRGAAFSIIGS